MIDHPLSEFASIALTRGITDCPWSMLKVIFCINGTNFAYFVLDHQNRKDTLFHIAKRKKDALLDYIQ